MPRRAARAGARNVAWGWLALLALLLAGCRSTPHGGDRTAAPAPPLEVATLNIWHDREDWPRRQALMVDALRALDPDVILLQEVLQDATLPNQAESLAQQLGYSWHFVSVDPPDRVRRYGNAILTRDPPIERGGQSLQPLDDYRVVGWVRASVRGRPVNFYVVHLNFGDPSGATRARQLRDVMDFVEATRGDAPVVIGGDFNTTAGSVEMAPLRAAFIDSYAAGHPGIDVEGTGHVTLNPVHHEGPARIDHVFAQRGAFRPVRAMRILDRPAADGTWATDHFGMWTRLEWVASPP
jgi:endonuclease/exonuclease/phosphatase family metal-dependent hydrolase